MSKIYIKIVENIKKKLENCNVIKLDVNNIY